MDGIYRPRLALSDHTFVAAVDTLSARGGLRGKLVRAVIGTAFDELKTPLISDSITSADA